MKWQPIQTAPKDGRPLFLIWAPNGEEDYRAFSPGWDGDGWTTQKAGDGYWIDPTHWLPDALEPDPPEK